MLDTTPRISRGETWPSGAAHLGLHNSVGVLTGAGGDGDMGMVPGTIGNLKIFKDACEHGGHER